MMMRQTSAAIRSRIAGEEMETALLRLAGEVSDVHALILGEHGIELMCGLLHRGCAAVAAFRSGDRPEEGSYGLVLVPDAGVFGTPEALIGVVRRSLVPGGRLVVGGAAATLGRRLRLNRFVVHLAGSGRLRADRRQVP
jgi:hypothetical protein